MLNKIYLTYILIVRDQRKKMMRHATISVVWRASFARKRLRARVLNYETRAFKGGYSASGGTLADESSNTSPYDWLLEDWLQGRSPGTPPNRQVLYC